MRKLTTFQIVLLSVFGALGVTGVLIFALAVGGGNNESIGPVELWGTFDAATVSLVLQQAADVDERLGAVTYVKKDPTTYETELTNALASGVGPDLFFLRQDYVVKNATKTYPIPLESLPRSDFRETFVEAADPYSTSVGTLAIPLLVDPLVLYWNRDILGEHGYAKPPLFWDEIPAMAETITTRNEGGGIKRATIAFGEAANIPHAKSIVSALILQAGGSITRQNEEGTIEPALAGGEGTLASSESALRFYTEFADPSKVDYSWNRSLPPAQKAFAAGDVALYVGFASEAGAITAANPNLNFAIARLPQIRDAARQVNTARVYGLAISRASDNPTGAMTAASTLAKAEFSKLFSSAFGMPSALRDVLAVPAEGYFDLFQREALIARSWIDPDPEKTNAIFRGMIESVSSGALRLSDAIMRADQEIGELIEI